MNSSINLLGHKDKDVASPASQKLKLLRTIAALLLFCVSSAAVILYILISLSALPQVQQQEQQALQTLSRMHPEMTKIAYVQNRVNGITNILSQRNKYDTFLDNIAAQMPQDLTIYQISMSKKTATLTVKGNSLDSLKSFLENLTQAAESKKDYSQVTLNSIISDDESNDFSLTVTVVLL